VIKKVNAAKNFDGGAIIPTPKRQLLAQKRHTDCLRLVHRFFVQLILLPNPQNPMLYNAFQLTRHPKSDIPMRASAFPCTGSTPLTIPNCILIGSAIFAQLTAESPYTLQWLLKHH